jgi:hypothetical protein
MTEMTTMPEGPRPKRVNGKQDKQLGPVLVSGNRLAVHFGVPIEARTVLRRYWPRCGSGCTDTHPNVQGPATAAKWGAASAFWRRIMPHHQASEAWAALPRSSKWAMLTARNGEEDVGWIIF